MRDAYKPTWSISLARRVLVWGLSVAGIVGGAALLWELAFLALWFSGPMFPPEPAWGAVVNEPTPFAWIVTMAFQNRTVLFYSCLSFSFAAILGFYSPKTEPDNPWKSQYFRSIVASSLQLAIWLWLALCLLSAVVSQVLSAASVASMGLPSQLILGLFPLAFGLSLFFVLHRSPRAAKSK